eukprot:scaffold6521_cov93-Cylindrotheca_fusiformis.AAC.4
MITSPLPDQNPNVLGEPNEPSEAEEVSEGATSTIGTSQPDVETVHEEEEPPAEEVPTSGLRRSRRQKRIPERFQGYLLQRNHAFVAFEALDEFSTLEGADEEDPLFAFAAKAGDPDTMYLHEAMRAPDADEFLKAMKKEVQSHEERGHWELIERKDVPEGHKTLPAVWAMKRKRKVATGEIYKRKARLNVGGHKQEKHVNFWQTYSPVVGWVTIRFFLILALLNNWHARQFDFVLAYPQADIEVPLYMDIPRGFEVPGGRNRDYCLRLIKNLFGQKQAGRVWNKHLHKGLIGVGFVQSSVDECLYYRGSTILLIYVDDCIMIDADPSKIQQTFEDIKAQGYDMTDEGDLKDYLGVDVDRRMDGTIHLSQPKLIAQILGDVFFNERTKEGKENPALIGQTLQKSLDEDEHDKTWSYRSIIGKLNFLEKSTRPEIAFATHQAARFSADPRKPHSKAVLHLCVSLPAGHRQERHRVPSGSDGRIRGLCRCRPSGHLEPRDSYGRPVVITMLS